MTLDGELLHRYVESDFEAAFAELVRRHLDLVYSAALRPLNAAKVRRRHRAHSPFASFLPRGRSG